MTLDNCKKNYALFVKQKRVVEAEQLRQNTLTYRGVDLALPEETVVEEPEPKKTRKKKSG